MADSIQRPLAGRHLHELYTQANKKYEEQTDYVSTLEKCEKTPNGNMFDTRSYQFTLDNFERATDVEARFVVTSGHKIGGIGYKNNHDKFFSPIQSDGTVKQKTAKELFGDVPMRELSFDVTKTDLFAKLQAIGTNTNMTTILEIDTIFERIVTELGISTISSVSVPTRDNLTFNLLQSDDDRESFNTLFDDLLSAITHTHDIDKTFPAIKFGRADAKPWTPLNGNTARVVLKPNNILKFIRILYGCYKDIPNIFTNLEKFLIVKYLYENMVEDFVSIGGVDSSRRIDLKTTTVIASMFMCLTVTDKNKGAYYITNKALKLFDPNFDPLLLHDPNIKSYLENMDKMLDAKAIFENCNIAFSSAIIVDDTESEKLQNGLLSTFRRLGLELSYKIPLNNIEAARNKITDLKKLAAADFSNFIDKVSLKHDGGIDVTFTRDQLVVLFGDKFITVTSIKNRPKNSTYHCTMKLGVTSDFRLKDDEPLYFDPGRFQLKIHFKEEAHKKIFTTINAVESTLAYTVEKRKPKPGICEAEITNNRFGFYRVPIPYSYLINVGPTTIPDDIKVPLNKHGESFIVSVAAGNADYFLTPNLGDIDDYLVEIKEPTKMQSLVYDFSVTAVKQQSLQNTNTFVCHLNERETLFSGFDTKRQNNLVFKFDNTNSSKKLSTTYTQSLSIIPIVEYGVKYSDAHLMPKRAFSKLKTDDKSQII